MYDGGSGGASSVEGTYGGGPWLRRRCNTGCERELELVTSVICGWLSLEISGTFSNTVDERGLLRAGEGDRDLEGDEVSERRLFLCEEDPERMLLLPLRPNLRMDKCLPDKNEAAGAGSAITDTLSLFSLPPLTAELVPEVDPLSEAVATNPSGRAMKTGSVDTVSDPSTELTPLDDAPGMNVAKVVVVVVVV